MCTVTVHRIHDEQVKSSEQSLVVTMNRDERRDRAAELQPQIYTDALYPLDSEAGGTWFGINKYGVCLSLLNRYDAINYTAKRSRGLLIPELLIYRTVSSIKAALLKIDLKDFAPFTLMINTFDTCEIIQWSGQEFILQHPMISEYMHLSSSSWKPKAVLPWRQTAFEEWVENGAQYHKNKLPLYNLHQPLGKADYAPLVSREQSYTKSITQYHCQNAQVSSFYWNDKALPNGKPVSLTMPLHTV